MATSTTTLGAIRRQQASTIEGLTPTSMQRDKFELHRGETGFGEWVEENATRCLRVFSIIYAGMVEPPAVHDEQVRQEHVAQSLEIAYPRQWGRYGQENIRDAEDLIMEDKRQIEDAIGIAGASNYASGQLITEVVGHDIADGDAVLVSVFDLETRFSRSVS